MSVNMNELERSLPNSGYIPRTVVVIVVPLGCHFITLRWRYGRRRTTLADTKHISSFVDNYNLCTWIGLWARRHMGKNPWAWENLENIPKTVVILRELWWLLWYSHYIPTNAVVRCVLPFKQWSAGGVVVRLYPSLSVCLSVSSVLCVGLVYVLCCLKQINEWMNECYHILRVSHTPHTQLDSHRSYEHPSHYEHSQLTISRRPNTSRRPARLVLTMSLSCRTIHGT